MKKLAIVALFSLGTTLSISTFAKDCEAHAQNQGEVIQCEYDSNLKPLEQQVKNEYRLLLSDIKKKQSDSKDTLQSLATAQESWIKYRDNTCEFLWNKDGAATVSWAVQYNCQMDFTKSRIKTLQRYRQEINTEQIQ